jgi:tetratricopeptide (TPR) repeat protein
MIGLLGAAAAAAEPAAPEPATEWNNRGVRAAQAGQFEEAARWLRQGLQADPADASVRRNLGGVLLDWALQEAGLGHLARAISLLEEAVSAHPELGQAWASLGNLYYVTRPDFSAAIEAWQQAHSRVPAAQGQELAARIAQAERDRHIERTFAGQETAHFVLRAEPDLPADAIADVGTLLEQEYGRLQGVFGSALPARVTVLLYGASGYRRIAGRKDWSLGLYDGRIRLRIDELSAQQLPAVAAHELTHAYVTSLYGPALPVWVQEGLAQLQEPPQPMSPRQAQVRSAIEDRTGWIPLKWLGQRFERPGHAEDLERAYMESRLVMEALFAQHDPGAVQEWLRRLGRGEEIGAAFEQAFPGARWARFEQGAWQP